MKDDDDKKEPSVTAIAEYVKRIADDVHHPAHYLLFPDLEVVDAIVTLLTPEEFVGYCKGNILKYRLRAGKKGDKIVEDIKKASVYEEWLAEVFDY